MTSKAAISKAVKDLGWTQLVLTPKKGFVGAAHAYQSTKGGTVAVAFNFGEAFTVSDDQGLFSASDIIKYVAEEKSTDFFSANTIEGTEILAWVDGDVIAYDEELLEKHGLNDFETKESLRVRLTTLAEMDFLEDLPLD